MPSEVFAGADEDLRRRVDALERELAESREQQAATAQILAGISNSPTEPQRVFAQIAASAARLCEAHDAAILQLVGDELLVVAVHGLLRHVGPIGQGKLPLQRGILVARAVIEKKTIHVADLQAETEEYPAGSDFARRLGHRTIVAVPLLSSGDAIGAITVRRTEMRPFTDRQIELLKTFADQAVIAIENTRLFEAERSRTRELQESLEYQTATSNVLDAISRTPSQLQPVVDAIVQTATRLCSAERATMWTWRDGKFDLIAHTIVDPALAKYLKDNPIPPDHTSLATRAVRQRRTMHVPDLQAEPELGRKYQVVLGKIRTLLAVPLLRKGEPIGVLSLSKSEVDPFSQSQIALVETFADQAVIAIENARLFEAEQASKRELQQSLEYQTATSEVLGVISRSKFELQPVIDTIVETAIRLCEAERGAFLRFEENGFRLVPTSGSDPGPISAGMIGKLIPFDRGSIAGRVAIDRSTVHVHDMQADSEITLMRGTAGDTRRTALGVPLLGIKGPLGAIVLQRTVVRPFTERQIRLVQTFADQAVIAIENTRLFEAEQASKRELQESLEYQTATAEVLSVISKSPHTLRPVLDAIIETAARLCQADYARFRLLRGDAYHVVARLAHDPDPPERHIPLRAGRDSVVGRVVLEGRTIHIPDVHADPTGGTYAATRRLAARTVLGVPLLKQGEVVGIIMLFRDIPQAFSARQIALVETFASQATIAFENTRLFEAEQASKRELTDALEQQTATGEILGVISRSPNDLQPVLDALVKSATKFCGADDVTIFRIEGDHLVSVAHFGPLPNQPGLVVPVVRGTTTGRSLIEKRTVHLPDLQAEAVEFPKAAPSLEGLTTGPS